MRVHFIGIGGTGIGPLAMIASQLGYDVSGSDKQDSQYIQYLKKHGTERIYIGGDSDQLSTWHEQTPVDWLVHTSAVNFENPDHPELVFARENDIRISKRDEFLNHILETTGKKLIAIAGTHGKTTTTAMTIWLFKQLGIPLSYMVGAKIPFGDMGNFDQASEYFVYECDEFDRNFLSFHPYISLITGIDYDHHEIYKSVEDYRGAFKQFLSQSSQNIVWKSDVASCGLELTSNDKTLSDQDEMLNTLSIVGQVNRRNALQVMTCVSQLSGKSISELTPLIESFPGLSRRFEKITDNLYSDYAHTIPKIAGCLQMAKELSQNVVVVYEPLTNRRQHFIKSQYRDLFQGVKNLYWVPSYLAREDPDQAVLTPSELIEEMSNKEIAKPAELNDDLKNTISGHTQNGDLVVCISGGGGGSLDEWLRREF